MLAPVVAAITQARAFAEEQMLDSCRIERITGPAVLNTTTLQYDPAPRMVLYAGKCRFSAVQGTRVRNSVTQAEERLVYEQARGLTVPISVTDVHVDDLITMTSSVADGDLPGKSFLVHAVERRSFLSSRRILCKERTT